MLAALALTFLATTIAGLQRILDTVELDGDQWRACLIAVIGYLVLAELGKFILRRIERRRASMSSLHLEPPASAEDRRRTDRRPAAGRTRDRGRPRRARHRLDGWRRLRGSRPRELDAAAKAVLAEGIEQLADAQELLWASDTCAVLVVFQAMDAAGKDSTIKHVMSGVNPQGVDVISFSHPSSEELDHTFLWRIAKAVPERGRIGIFNRSHYEEVVALRVHPEWLDRAELPPGDRGARLLGRTATPTSTRSNGTSTAPARSRQVLPQRLQGGAEAALHRSARQPGQGVEVQRRRRRRAAPLGRLHGGVRGGHHRHVDRVGAVVRASRPTTST